MPRVTRVLDADPVDSLAHYVRSGGGDGLEAARRMGSAGVIEELEASGLRGRGGAGFPTGTKWRTVAEHRSPELASTVVVNGAEGEPGSFKDRAILRRNPYKVLEGAIIAAGAVGADGVVLALKQSFTRELERVRAAVAEVVDEGWPGSVELFVVEGPAEYLYGEETALLEVVAGRAPFPRIAPPYRHGVDGPGEETSSSADMTMAGTGGDSATPPTLVNNVETLANVPAILAHGPDWFREHGTPQSPGTIVCTVTGAIRRHGVGEFAMGTPLREVIHALGRRPAHERIVAAMSGVAHPLVPEDRLDTALTYEDMERIDSGLGAAGFIVFDDETDMAAVAHGVSRFLAVESCGQCTPCKGDGLAIAELLDGLRRSASSDADLDNMRDRLTTVSDEARCFLAHQHERVVGSIVALFPEALRAHAQGTVGAADAALVAPIVDLESDRAVLDERHEAKQPDWTYDAEDSGQWPAPRVDQAAGESV